MALNFKTTFVLVLANGFFLFSCKNTQIDNNQKVNIEKTTDQLTENNKKMLIGSWEDQSKSALHFSLFEDGTAQSDNMATLLYQRWSVKDNKITLEKQKVSETRSLPRM